MVLITAQRLDGEWGVEKSQEGVVNMSKATLLLHTIIFHSTRTGGTFYRERPSPYTSPLCAFSQSRSAKRIEKKRSSYTVNDMGPV